MIKREHIINTIYNKNINTLIAICSIVHNLQINFKLKKSKQSEKAIDYSKNGVGKPPMSINLVSTLIFNQMYFF